MEKLIALLLSELSDRFSCDSCNDFHLVKDGGLTEEESEQIKTALYQAEYTENITDGPYTYNWMLANYLAQEVLK